MVAAALLLELLCSAHPTSLQPEDARDQPSSVFDRVMYINLPSATERKRHVEHVLQAANLHAPLLGCWNGTVPTDADVHEAVRSFRSAGVDISKWDAQTQRGTVGCRAGHTSLLRHLLATGSPGEVYLAVEDDVILPAQFEPTARAALAHVPANWDVLRLSCRLFPHGPGPRPLGPDPPCPPCIANVSSPARGALPTFRVSNHPEAATCDTAARPHCSYVSGGAHAVVYRYDSIAKVLDGMGGQPNYDVALSMPRDAAIASYCVQVPGVGVGGLSYTSTRTGTSHGGAPSHGRAHA